jgi:hypothetical protein
LSPPERNYRFAFCLCCFLLSLAATAWGAVGGSISGTVKDPSGSVVPNATVIVQEINTGLISRTQTGDKGYYTLPVLPIGRYDLEVQAPGFRAYRRRGIVLDTNAALKIDASLEVGSANESVNVNDDSPTCSPCKRA